MKKIFVLTGEPSGDKLASTLISKLKLQYSEIEYLSVGGTHLKNLGIKKKFNIYQNHYSKISKKNLKKIKLTGCK